MTKRRWVLSMICVVVVSAAGYGFNLIETAGPVGGQQVALTFGFGMATTDLGGGGTWVLVPQGRLTIGLSEGLDLGRSTAAGRRRSGRGPSTGWGRSWTSR